MSVMLKMMLMVAGVEDKLATRYHWANAIYGELNLFFQQRITIGNRHTKFGRNGDRNDTACTRYTIGSIDRS
uniref:Putative secreted peptide n=1 Tax=Anopheles braziliensis TaxID=58242 RepID=A0A2M3ZSA0_9DIPT